MRNILHLLNAAKKIDLSMLRTVFLLIMTVLAMQASADGTEKQPAFPGAEGFGRYVTGGRGGTVYHVRSLADDGSEGTLRWACEQKGRRTIVFDVSGTVHLTSTLALSEGNVTIAGQTAPGQGICLADYPFQVKANNVIIRYLRFRLGNKNVHVGDADGWDGLGAMDQSDIIVDHCSVSWSIDECLSIYGVKNSTVQWCISSQSLNNSGHSKGAHGYGGNWGGSGITYHHNLMAHHKSRTPRLGPRYTTQLDERMDMRNNVIYNWTDNGCYGGEAMNVNIVNNYYKPGPGTDLIKDQKKMRIAGIGCRTTEYVTQYDAYKPTEHMWGKFFVDGNKNSTYDEVTQDNWTYGMYNQIDAEGNDGTFTDATKDTMRLSQPIPFVHVTTHTADIAYEKVLQLVGCSKERDSYDEMIINDTRNRLASYTGTGNAPGIIDTQDDNKPTDAASDWSAWPTLRQDATPVDTDGDGMPDDWETANGLNPNDASDGATVGDDGYTNLEHYLNGLVESITNAGLEDGTVLGENIETDASVVDYTFDTTTAESEKDDVVWKFSNGCTITSDKGNRGYAEGKNNGLKYSRNYQFIINLPQDVEINTFTVAGYCNKAGKTSYLGELNGTTFGSTDYVFNEIDGTNMNTYTINLNTPAKEKLTFTFNGDDQTVALITLKGAKATSGIRNVSVNSTSANSKTYNLQGMEVKSTTAKGIYIRNGKKFAVK